jgi:hypothetical protein
MFQRPFHWHCTRMFWNSPCRESATACRWMTDEEIARVIPLVNEAFEHQMEVVETTVI